MVILLSIHLPFVGRLTALLVAGREEPPVAAFLPGSIACLERDELLRRTLAWMPRRELMVDK